MSYKVIKNRIPELISELEGFKASQALKFSAAEASQILLAEMRNRTPVGRVEPNYTIKKSYGSLTISHGRPSLRQHGMTLGSGWVDPQVETNAKRGISFKLISVAPHMQLLLEGAPPHSIPRAGHSIQSFWWYGAPYTFKASIYSRTFHPGFEGKTFVDDSVERIRPIILMKLREGTELAIAGFRKFFGKG